ncbi:MAG TPA: hypothetical protein PLD23_13545, partial [Armatimonadota bacterium]|nr:hypothetical protein [Armatimonadota bacterium]
MTRDRIAAVIVLAAVVCVLGVGLAQDPHPGPPRDLDSQLRDIRGPVQYVGPVPWGRIVLIAAGLLALAALVGLLAVVPARRRASRPVPTAKAPETAGDRAVRRLQVLATSGLWERGEYARFADQLSSILREFVARTFDTGAARLTTDELVQQLRRSGEAESADGLQDLLGRCDLAKFA